MLEAVNSVISNAPLLRGNAEQASAARSFASNPDRVQEVAQAPYISPYISVDNDYNKAVLQLRNSRTGDVEDQIPSEERLAQIRAAEERRQLETLQAQSRNAERSSANVGPARAEGQETPQSEPSTETAQPERTVTQSTPQSAQQIAAFSAGAETARSESDSGNVSVTA